MKQARCSRNTAGENNGTSQPCWLQAIWVDTLHDSVDNLYAHLCYTTALSYSSACTWRRCLQRFKFLVFDPKIKLAIPLGSLDLSEPYFSLLIIRKQDKYQKVNTYEHSLQTLSGASSFEENLPRVGLTPEKKCKRSRAAFVLAGTLRVPAHWKLML